ncbi:HAD family hydrolase [Bacteroides caecimuris]|jgi:haloacid dehalogenase superfamily, subfamily IA, variant 3 with third motif having DD or ED|uniref:HAD family hydrolase n=1 Tax=Bacteroides caecimuris TaxID=1796613 RepID=UPI00257089C5|nr:HAD family phosphatase [Bacteroides caecimuris]
MIKNLIFDFGKVLVDYDFQHVLNRYFKEDKESERKFCDIFMSKEFIDACDRELIPFEELIKETQRAHPYFHDALDFFYDNYTEYVTNEIEGMKELLVTLKKMGFKLYGLSNWCSAVHEIMRRYDIFDLLDGRVVSCEEQVIKPETEIYMRLCKRFGLIPSECLFTDDKIENIRGAESIGMNAVLFTSTKQYVNDIENLYNISVRK